MKNKHITIFIENDSHYRFVYKLVERLYKENKLRIISLERISHLPDHENITLSVFSHSKELISSLLNLECDLFFTTTPGLNSSSFPKSKISPKNKRPKYIYLFHSLVSPNEMYSKNSFYNFDYIISPSETVGEQLKFLIGGRTKILNFGYLLFDNMPAYSFKNYKEKVLIAPSWGDQGLSKNLSAIQKIIKSIDSNKLDTVFRPHPMNIDDFDDENFILDNCEIDLNLDLKNLQDYKFLITDCSGIALEYYFLTERPVLFINVPKKRKRNLTFAEKKLNLIEDDMKQIIGTTIEPNEIDENNIIPYIDNLKLARNFINGVCISENVLRKIVNYEFD
tara:strand:+ start:2124 stop:3131 length:1008 start_codon:yes stop_codon:yes gene_type:complete